LAAGAVARVAPSYGWAERFGGFLIIALGESIVLSARSQVRISDSYLGALA